MAQRHARSSPSPWRISGCRNLLVYCGSIDCSHGAKISGHRFSDDTAIKPLGDRMVCTKYPLLAPSKPQNPRRELAPGGGFCLSPRDSRPPSLLSTSPLDQRCNQAQEFLLLRSVAGRDEKRPDLNVGDLSARRKIGLVPHEHPAAIGIKGEQPPIAVGTDVNGSSPSCHVAFAPAHYSSP